jgi:hypothetical protein
MKTGLAKWSFLALTAALAACSTTKAPSGSSGGLEVARFHLGQPVAPSQIAIEAFDKGDAARPEFATFSAAVARQLSALGWTVVPSGSEQVALIDVERGSRDAIGALTAARIGRGVAPSAAVGSAEGLTATLLEVAIRRRSDGTVFWEGRAVGETRTGAQEDTPSAVVERLAAALFRDFPGESGRSIRVK